MAIKSVKPQTGIKGMDVVLSNLNKEFRKIEYKSKQSLSEIAVMLNNDMNKTSPTIPIDYGNLRSSWRAVVEKGTKGIFLLMGFMANYAAYVHEMVDAKFKKPGSGAKFFEAALKRNALKIVYMLQQKLYIK